MLQRKVVGIYYCYAALLGEHETKMVWSDQSGVRLGTALLLDQRCSWHDEQLHGCILRLLLSSQPHAQQVTVPRAVDDSVTLK